MVYQPVNEHNRGMVNRFLAEHWGAAEMVIRGEVVDMTQVEGITAMADGAIAGLITYVITGDTMEITSLDSLIENKGTGTALLEKAVSIARRQRCRRIILVTTNDNLRAMGFYQKRGFDMASLYRNAVDAARKKKPQIPLIGNEGIPLKHEIEFEMQLTSK